MIRQILQKPHLQNRFYVVCVVVVGHVIRDILWRQWRRRQHTAIWGMLLLLLLLRQIGFYLIFLI